MRPTQDNSRYRRQFKSLDHCLIAKNKICVIIKCGMKKFLNFYIILLYIFLFIWIFLGTVILLISSDLSNNFNTFMFILKFILIILLIVFSMINADKLIKKSNAIKKDYLMAFGLFIIGILLIFIF